MVIKEDCEPLGSGHDGLQTLKLAYAIYDSVSKECVVRLKGK